MKLITENNRKWWILISIAVCLSMAFIDMSAVAVMLPELRRSFGMSEITQQWVFNAFLLMLAAFILLGGKLSDIIGHRRCFLFGLSGFLLASLVCGCAINTSMLIIGRLLQGITGAILFPNTSISIINAFPAGQRGMAMGIYVSIGTVFLNLGPIIGGGFAQYLTWRLVFLINLPLGLLSIYLASISIPKSYNKFVKEKIDWLGAITMVISTTSLVCATMEGAYYGWNSAIIISLFAIALIGYTLFIIIERRVKTPLVNFEVLRQPNLVKFCIIRFCMQICVESRMYWVVFFQMALGVQPFIAGLMMLPSTVPNIILSPIVGRVLDRTGPRPLVIIGFCFLICGFCWAAWFAPHLNYPILLVTLLFMGIGFPFIGNPLYTTVLSAVPSKHRGIAAGTFTQMRELGGTIGIALFGAILTNLNNKHFVTFVHYHKLSQYFTKSNVADMLLTHNLGTLPATITPELHAQIYHAAEVSYAIAFRYGVLLTAVASLIGLIFIVVKKRSPQTNSVMSVDD